MAVNTKAFYRGVRARRRGQRQGIVILVVLSLLALFAVFVVTFLVMAGNYRTTAAVASRYRRSVDDDRRLFERTAQAFVRDTIDETSALRGQSLLRDMYGDDGFGGVIVATPSGPVSRLNGQIIEFYATFGATAPNSLPGYYNGCVLTATSGNGRDTSMRIVGYAPPTTTTAAAFRVLVPPGDTSTASLVQAGDTIQINGRPFSGEGFGLNGTPSANSTYGVTWKNDRPHPGPDGVWGRPANPATGFNGDDDGDGTIDEDDEWLWPGSDDGIACLFPNNLNLAATDPRVIGYALGGGDEDYDAVDFQNMFLGTVLHHAPNMAQPTFVEPSFHRTALIDFWYRWISLTWLTPLGVTNTSNDHLAIFLQPFGPDNYPPGHALNSNDEHPHFIATPQHNYVLTQIANLKRLIILRPLPEHNPEFTGSNAAFTPSSGPWDVDNDGDGIADSIWLDVGLPMRTSAEGQTIKPLVAMLCLDMDGRLNVNAHGFPRISPPAPLNWAASAPPTRLASGASAAATLPYGLGFGPAEVDISKLFGGTDSLQILFGNPPAAGRYGSDRVPGIAGLDPMSQIAYLEFPINYFNSATYQSTYHSPPDMWGESQVGLDYHGQPDRTISNTTRDMLSNNPYEFNQSSYSLPGSAGGNSPKDRPFDVAELEQLLRRYDFLTRDARSLPQEPGRLPTLASALSTSSSALMNASLVTTHSFDLPIPNLARPADFSTRRLRHIGELIRERIVRNFSLLSVPYTPRHDAGLGIELAGGRQLDSSKPWFGTFGLVAPELLLGTRMNVNRKFGNGKDDNGNYIVDEHWQIQNWAYNESFVDLSATPPLFERLLGPSTASVRTDPDNDGQPSGSAGYPATDADAFMARQIFARHLYILALALKPRDYHFNGKVTSWPTIIDNAADEEDARVLAQWAVNVVDFLDPDTIMTPFEYDINPFMPSPGPNGVWGSIGDDDGQNGPEDIGEALYTGSDDTLWSVDGWFGVNPLGEFDDLNPRRRLVWGCERPELLITESMAWHDTKAENLPFNGDVDPMSMNPEMDGTLDLDQQVRPQGAAFIELYNPWTAPTERPPAELYADHTVSPPQWYTGVLLNKVTATNNSVTGLPDPVWRLVFTRPSSATDDNDDLEDAAPPEPLEPTDLVYFTATGGIDVVNTTTVPASRIHRPVQPVPVTQAASSNPIPIAPIPPGRYAVVGTYRGNQQDLIDPNTGTTDSDPEYAVKIGRSVTAGAEDPLSATRRIVLHPNADPNLNWVAVDGNAIGGTSEVQPKRVWYSPPNGAVPTGYGTASIQPTVAIPVHSFQLSEGSYPPKATSDPDPDPEDGEQVYTTPFDVPFDNAQSPSNHANVRDAAFLANDGIGSNFRCVHLQRLANPLLPFDAATNPYLTVDSMSVDLMVFNGSDRTADPQRTTPRTMAFRTTQRGAGDAEARSLWRHVALSAKTATAQETTALINHIFQYGFDHTLGHCNSTYLAAPPLPAPVPPATVRYSRYALDYDSPSVNTTSPTAPGADYVGSPDLSLDGSQPFAWLTWNNRPFISPYELMMVPRSRSSKLLRDFAVNVTPTAGTTVYSSNQADTSNNPPTSGTNPRGPGQPAYYGHLLNFFASSYQFYDETSGTGTTIYGPDLYKLFELLHVPSPFLGTQTWLSANDVTGNAAGSELLHPPFHGVSTFRDPGKINLNTIPNSGDTGAGVLAWNSVIWDAILGDYHATSTPLEIATSRRGGNEGINGGTPVTPMSSSGLPNYSGLPSFTANAFRGADSASLVPFTLELERLLHQRGTGVISDVARESLRMQRPDVDVTLLRGSRVHAEPSILGDPAAADPAAALDNPLFDEVPAGNPVHRNALRNPFFRYRQLFRLPNLTTTRSNVFAVWMTIGYFQIDPLSGRLGQEAGTETGNLERHRAFYMIDRSIPVAFEPGVNHNSDRVILLRRFLE